MELHSYCGHFFARYNERLGLGLQTPYEKMKRYFLTCFEISYQETSDNRFHAELSSGIGFGYRVNQQWLHFKTFVTPDMLQGQQIETSQMIRQELAIKDYIYHDGDFTVDPDKRTVKAA